METSDTGVVHAQDRKVLQRVNKATQESIDTQLQNIHLGNSSLDSYVLGKCAVPSQAILFLIFF